ncbi:MAG TPA: type VI secretion system tube protein TssD [Chitinophaga sp.]|uniref:type VI secretion system tube protein TssD n=1 Tax=Chitinophaga sp. TaxID=1869181 RepID=UPI002C765C78|nr:type VI secretion system tube protein TssD [Chitinophaga sp.]HVI46866.1 type VI secretion system tube protein TssD [Chitinophaga sp.]
MSFKAVLNIDGEELNVLECSFSFSQSTDHNGKPAARPKGGTINVLVESAGETTLFDWMISNTQTKNGSIIFFRRDSMSRLKELKFSDAYCVAYTEQFNAFNEQPLRIQMTLSSRELKLNNSLYQNPWPL